MAACTRSRRRLRAPAMAKVPKLNIARVWCGVMPRVGSKNHMRFCQDCRRVRRLYWRVVREQSDA